MGKRHFKTSNHEKLHASGYFMVINKANEGAEGMFTHSRTVTTSKQEDFLLHRPNNKLTDPIMASEHDA